MNSLDTWNSRVYELDSIFTTIFKDKEAGAQLLKVTMAEDVSCLANIYSSLSAWLTEAYLFSWLWWRQHFLPPSQIGHALSVQGLCGMGKEIGSAWSIHCLSFYLRGSSSTWSPRSHPGLGGTNWGLWSRKEEAEFLRIEWRPWTAPLPDYF